MSRQRVFALAQVAVRMKRIGSIPSMQRLAKQWRGAGIKIGFVPTMGYLHEGHITLVERARRLVGKKGKVVVSIYVNPTQFGPKEDFTKYPRNIGRDSELCRNAGVDAIFTPRDRDMYHGREEGFYSTYVVEERLALTMEGASRPTHFRGVTTVVAKLFNIVLPDVAVFGAKDWQQATIIRRMVVDLNFPLRIVVAPTHREPDGLAMSSRNKYLSPAQRVQAIALWEAIQEARRVVKSERPISSVQLKDRLARAIHERPETKVDYIEFFDPDSLQAEPIVRRGTHMALAVYVGKTRLIDNARL